MSEGRSPVVPSPGDLPRAGAPAPGAGGADPPRSAGGAAAAPAAGAILRVAGRCAWQVVEGEAVLLDLHGSRIVGLNPVGSYVFERLDGTRNVARLAGDVAARFGVVEPRALADVSAFLAELARRGLVEEVRS
jgi:hypothetical protein